MAIFNRRKNVDNNGLSREVNEYYQAETREKTWMAWLLGFVTLVVTILLALAIFYGGRWVYRQIRGNDVETSTTQTEQEADKQGETSEANGTNESGNTSSESSSQGSTNGGSTNSGNTNTGSSPSTNPGTAPAPAAPSTPSTNQASGTNQTTKIPNTGPADTLAIFISVSLLAYVAHRKFGNA